MVCHLVLERETDHWLEAEMGAPVTKCLHCGTHNMRPGVWPQRRAASVDGLALPRSQGNSLGNRRLLTISFKGLLSRVSLS